MPVGAYVPDWGQSAWSSTLRSSKNKTPYNAWGEPAPMHRDEDAYKFDGLRTPTEAETVGAAAAERLFTNRRHYSDSTKRWRSGTQCRRKPARRGKPRRVAPAPPGSTTGLPLGPGGAQAAAPALWAENVTRRRKPKSSGKTYAEAPQLSKQKRRDYGNGIPSWSPYNNSKSNSISRTTANAEYGEFTKHQYLKSLARLMADQGRRSGADMKMILDPSSSMHCAAKDYKTY